LNIPHNLHGKLLARRPRLNIFSTVQSELWRNAGPSALQMQKSEDYVEKWQNMI